MSRSIAVRDDASPVRIGGGEGDAHQQRRRGGRRTPRVAHGVAGGEPAHGTAAGQVVGQPDQPRHQHRPHQQHADEGHHAAREHRGHRAAGDGQGEQDPAAGEAERGQPEAPAARRRADVDAGVGAQRGQRGDPRRRARRQPGGPERDQRADGERATRAQTGSSAAGPMSVNQRRTRATSPAPAATPTTIPTAAAARPSASASSRIARRSWRRVTPTQRSSAKSRIRWAKRIEKVLAMTSTPTKRAIATKSSAMIARTSTPREISAWRAATQSSADSTVGVGGDRRAARSSEPPHATASTQRVSLEAPQVLPRHVERGAQSRRGLSTSADDLDVDRRRRRCRRAARRRRRRRCSWRALTSATASPGRGREAPVLEVLPLQARVERDLGDVGGRGELDAVAGDRLHRVAEGERGDVALGGRRRRSRVDLAGVVRRHDAVDAGDRGADVGGQARAGGAGEHPGRRR